MNRIRIAAIAAMACLAACATTAVAHDPDHHGGQNADQHGEKVQARPGTKMSIAVRKDRFSGWNLLIRTNRFRFAPEHASERHRSGEGHAHLEIDGEPVTRLYGRGFYIAKLKPGRHSIRVALATNSHAEYVNAKGKPIADTAIVRAPRAAK